MIGRDFIQDLSVEERATWGTCSVCDARRGERCRQSDASTEVGVHIGRLRGAPIRVRVTPIFSDLPGVKGNEGRLWVPLTEFRS